MTNNIVKSRLLIVFFLIQNRDILKYRNKRFLFTETPFFIESFYKRHLKLGVKLTMTITFLL
jgi:hypothetical protein